MLLTLVCLAGAVHLPGQWQMAPPPSSDIQAPVIQGPTQQAPDPGAQIDALATGKAKRRLIQAQTEALRLANQQRQMDMQAEIEQRKAAAALPPTVSSMPAQDDPNVRWHTNGTANGRFWNDLAPNQKSAYLNGLWDGLAQAKGFLNAANVESLYPLGLTNGEIDKALDRFYDTPENIQVPIGWALVICRQRLQGVDESEVQKHILTFRQYAVIAPTLTPAANKQ